jgi:hypothetical protein
MNHKEITKHIRHRLNKAGVPCRVRMNDYCGAQLVQVVTPTYEARWTAEQLRQIGLIARVNHLTMARGMPVHDDRVMEQLTGATQFDFVFAQGSAA